MNEPRSALNDALGGKTLQHQVAGLVLPRQPNPNVNQPRRSGGPIGIIGLGSSRKKRPAMGGGSWSEEYYDEKAKERATTGRATFAHHEEIKAKPMSEQKVHERLDPKGVKVRESRDSLEHPNSLPIGIILDVTGSMQKVPVGVQKSLPNMNKLALKVGIRDAHFLFGAIGDEFSDRGSLQVGQFESDNRMDEDLQHFWLEGGGGPYGEESYQNVFYFFARHTEIDSLIKRNKKGYLFILGDELPFSSVRSSSIEKLLGYNLQGVDIKTEDIVRECQQKYNVFFVIPRDTSGGDNSNVNHYWEKLLGAQNVLHMANATDICELVATTVGICEGLTNIQDAKILLKDAGVSASTSLSIEASLYNLVKGRGLPVKEPTIRRL